MRMRDGKGRMPGLHQPEAVRGFPSPEVSEPQWLDEIDTVLLTCRAACHALIRPYTSRRAEDHLPDGTNTSMLLDGLLDKDIPIGVSVAPQAKPRGASTRVECRLNTIVLQRSSTNPEG